MDRRDAIKATTLILGYSVSGAALTGMLSGCGTNRTSEIEDWDPVFFQPHEADLIVEVAETILPATSTPGAKDAGAHAFIDVMLADCYSGKDQQVFRDGLVLIDARGEQDYGKAFLKCTAEQRTALLTAIEKEQYEARQVDDGNEAAAGRFFPMLKELTYLGYFSSELIGEEYLNYDPVPGAYLGCVPVTDVGNTWSL